MIYNFNLGIGWASSGVEYAQIYRAKMFRNIGVDAKFVFTDMFPQENIEHMTKNIGFEDSEVIWLYTFFTDFKTAPVTYTLSDLEKTFTNQEYTKNVKVRFVVMCLVEVITFIQLIWSMIMMTMCIVLN
ncbi:hypothetical protein [Holdemanella sp.]|uniref:hypothetical protein n=1 Tax=Holdemanella sp. TaxID=1971762 RepID=UPI00307C020D